MLPPPVSGSQCLIKTLNRECSRLEKKCSQKQQPKSSGTSGIPRCEMRDSEHLLLLNSLGYVNSSHALCQNADRLQLSREKMILWAQDWKTIDIMMG